MITLVKHLAISLLCGAATVAVAEEKKENPQRPRVIPSETKVLEGKKGDDAKIEFQGSTIKGIRKDPFSSYVDTKANSAYDFVKIRTNWHQEMIDSATSLDTQAKESGIQY